MPATASTCASASHPRGGAAVVVFIMAATRRAATALTSASPEPSAACAVLHT